MNGSLSLEEREVLGLRKVSSTAYIYVTVRSIDRNKVGVIVRLQSERLH
jgi:hypothetical protein